MSVMKGEAKMAVIAKQHKTEKEKSPYVGLINPKENLLYAILGGSKTIKKTVKSDLDYLELSMTGVPKSAIVSVAKYLGLTMKDMADLVNLSPKTLERKKPTDLLSESVSSQAIEIAATLAHGIQVFDTLEKFNHWVFKENRALKGKRPINIMNTATGLKMINALLTRIEEGVYS